MKTFNLMIVGVGGQGVLTLAGAIARAAMRHGYEVKTSELHGLSMRFGPLKCHVRFGKRVYSPLVRQADADLIMALEPIEALRVCYFASEKTKFLIDTKPIIPLAVHLARKTYPTLDKVVAQLKKFSKNIITTAASDAAIKVMGTTIAANTYLLGRAGSMGLIPLKKPWLLGGLKEVVPPKSFGINRKIFELGWRGT